MHYIFNNFLPDGCGICGGDNSQCVIMEGVYNSTADQVAYKTVVRIPKGSSNIKIFQYSAGVDENFLGKRKCSLMSQFSMRRNFRNLH